MNKTAAAIAAYALIAVVTFGHAAASAEKVAAAEYATCKSQQTNTNARVCLEGIPGMNGFLAGALWPLYWSWEAWK